MTYLTKEQILLIHSIIINETGGSHGVRNIDAILSVESAPKQAVFGKELYPSIFQKAAIYARDIISHHPFIDGNKRTGMTAATVFLENNGYSFYTQKGQVESFTLDIINSKLDIPKISRWFKKHSKIMYENHGK